MRRTTKRARVAPRLEPLEPRTLLSLELAGSSSSTPEAKDSLFVRFAANTPASVVQNDLNSVGARVIQSFPAGPLWVQVGAGGDRDTALRRLRSDPDVLYAEPDDTIQDQAVAVTPSNPLFSQQWGLNSPNDIDIDASEAWTVTTGSPATIVAVLDTGIDLTNPEFAGRIWVNPDPSGADGHPGDFNGWNFVSNTGDVQDDNGHGTHVSGILAATGNIGYGVAGVNWGARIMPVKVLDANGDGTIDATISGIYYAVQHGARVINASWGGGPYSQAMADAIRYADSQGVVFVTAAGNDGVDTDFTPSYPGSYRLPNMITVGAVDSSGNLASFSDFGAFTVDLVAPGVNILSTYRGTFKTLSGTSMATPYVSGVVSLLVGLHPEYSAEQLVQQVLASVKPLPNLQGLTATGGMVDAARTLGVNPYTVTPATQSPAGLSTPPTIPTFSTLTPTPTPKAKPKKLPRTVVKAPRTIRRPPARAHALLSQVQAHVQVPIQVHAATDGAMLFPDPSMLIHRTPPWLVSTQQRRNIRRLAAIPTLAFQENENYS